MAVSWKSNILNNAGRQASRKVQQSSSTENVKQPNSSSPLAGDFELGPFLHYTGRSGASVLVSSAKCRCKWNTCLRLQLKNLQIMKVQRQLQCTVIGLVSAAYQRAVFRGLNSKKDSTWVSALPADAGGWDPVQGEAIFPLENTWMRSVEKAHRVQVPVTGTEKSESKGNPCQQRSSGTDAQPGTGGFSTKHPAQMLQRLQEATAFAESKPRGQGWHWGNTVGREGFAYLTFF